MPRKAWVYIGFVYTAGLLITIFTGLKTDFTVSSQWSILLALVIFDTFAQIIKAEAPDHQLYHTNLVFHFAGVIMLEPFYYVLLVTIPHLIEWGRERTLNSIHLRDWYLQPFNICVHIIVGISAYFVYTAVTDQLTTLEMLATPLAVVVASIVYVFLNHVLVGLAIFFARGVPIRESGILELGNLSADLIMLLMGYTVAVFWKVNPWLIWVAMTPLFLVYKALTIPNLERQAQIDPKTGVWNTSYFNKSLQEELTRAQGLNRPMTIVMADLDLLRNINNTYGHLAGDVVLQGVASILRDSAEPYDVVARFGGEEFAILMPETTAEQAFLRVEAMRLAIQEANFVVATHEKPLKATMSFGIAGRMNSEQSAAQLVHCADIAVYQAKQNGRNQTYVYHYKRDSNLKIPTAVNELAADSSVNGTENGVATAVSSPTQLPGSASRPPQAPDTHKPAPAQSRHKKTTLKLTTNRYISLAVAFVIILALPLNYHWETIDGIGLAAFVILILIVEILSIDIYVKETTVSTAAAPYLAGVLLFGPAAAVILAPVIAIVVFIKQKSTLDRLIFNSSNHMMSGLLCAWLLSITGTSILEMPVYWQIIISVVT
ncbi:MAG: GGDEF domain-containing protein, partial [Anaerolineae bacterium]